MLGGVCVNTGTIPSKTLREAVVYLTGMSQRELYGASYRVKEEITPADLLARTQHVIGKEIDVVRSQLMRNRVELYVGHARFVDAAHHRSSRTRHAPSASRCHGRQHRHRRRHQAGPPARRRVRRGTRPRLRRHPRPEDDSRARWSWSAPASSASSTRRCSPRWAPRSPSSRSATRMLEFCDPEIVEALRFHLRDLAVTFRFGEEVTAVDVGSAGHRHHPGQRQADPRRHGDVLGGPAGPDRRPRPRSGGPGGRQPRPDLRRRQLPDQGRPHLRRRRRHRLPGAGRDLDGAGPAGGLPRVRRAVQRHDRAAAHRHLLDPRGRPTSAPPRSS